MTQNSCFRQNVFNVAHAPSDIERTSFADGIKTELSAAFYPGFSFSSLVLSANFQVADEGCLLLEAQVCCNGEWSKFYKLGLLAAQFKRSFPPQKDDFGWVETDELRLAKPAEAYRFRLKFSSDISLSGLWACGVRMPFVYEAASASRLPAGAFCKEVSLVSQMQQNHADHRRICSPTSLCMALNALGFSVTLDDLLHDVFDQTAAIYGNWTFNTAAAGMLGAAAYVRRFSALEELKNFVTPDSLVVASISYNEGALEGAPMSSTPGHLVVVRGWENGKILVADPAALKKEDVLRAYDAHQFAAAWLGNKQGAAYIVRIK